MDTTQITLIAIAVILTAYAIFYAIALAWAMREKRRVDEEMRRADAQAARVRQLRRECDKGDGRRG